MSGRHHRRRRRGSGGTSGASGGGGNSSATNATANALLSAASAASSMPPSSSATSSTRRGMARLEDRPTAYRTRIRAWFLALSVSERQMALAIEDAELVAMLRHMHSLACETGPLLFCSFRGDVDPASFRDLVWRRTDGLPACAFPDSLLVTDDRLCAALRLCDTRAYLDTLTVSTDALSDPRAFLRLLNAAARGSLLKRACLVQWSHGSWQWQAPNWFRGMGYWTLATYVASKFERALWAAFCAHANIDPRVQGTSVMYWSYDRRIGLRSKAHLETFWAALDAAARRRVVGRLGNIVESVLTRDYAASSAAAVVDFPAVQYLDLLSSLVGLAPQFGAVEPRGRLVQRAIAMQSSTASSAATTSSTSSHSTTPTSLATNRLATQSSLSEPRSKAARARTTDDNDNVPALLNDEYVLRDPHFVDRLFFSPLARAGTPRDLILRRIGQGVQTAYTSRFNIELIGGNKRRKGAAKDRRKNADAPSAPAASATSSVQELRHTQLHQQHRQLQRERKLAEKQREEEQEQEQKREQAPPVNVPADGEPSVGEPSVGDGDDAADTATNHTVSDVQSTTQALTAIADEALKEIVASVERAEPQRIARQRSVSAGTPVDKPVHQPENDVPVDAERDGDDDAASGAAPVEPHQQQQLVTSLPSDSASARRVRRRAQRNSMNALALSSNEQQPTFVIEEPFAVSKARSLPRSVRATPLPVSALGERSDERHKSLDEIRRPRAVSLTSDADASTAAPPSATEVPPPPSLDDSWAVVHRRRRATSPPPPSKAVSDATARGHRRQQSTSTLHSAKAAVGAVHRPWREAAATADDWSVGTRRAGRYTWSALSLSKKRQQMLQQPAAAVSPPQSPTPPPPLTAAGGATASFTSWPILSRMRATPPSSRVTDDWSVGNRAQPLSVSSHGVSHFRSPDRSLPSTPRREASANANLSPVSPTHVRPRAPMLRSIPGMELIIGAFNRVRMNVESSDVSLRSSSSGSSFVAPTAPFMSPPMLSPRNGHLSSSTLSDDWFGDLSSETESVSSISGSFHTADDMLSELGDAIDAALRPVWMPLHRRHYAHERLDVQLHVEIEDFVCFIYACFMARLNRQQQMIQRVRWAVARLWPGAQVEVYGSYATCLSIPSSDLDLVVVMPMPSNVGAPAEPLEPAAPAAAQQHEQLQFSVDQIVPPARQHAETTLVPMRALADELRARTTLLDMKLIERATIPVIKLKTETERIPTDITFHWDGASATSAHSGLAARDLVKSLLGRLPPLGALTLVTKQLLHERGLNDTFSGGLGSYCLVLLIAVFLDVASNEHKVSSPQLLPRRSVRHRSNSNPAAPDLGGGSAAAAANTVEQRKTLGTLLLNLFDFYGTRLNPKSTGVAWSAARGCGLLFPLPYAAPETAAPLVLLDPYNEQRNIAYNVFHFHMVQALFADAATALRAGQANEATLLSRIIRLSAEQLRSFE